MKLLTTILLLLISGYCTAAPTVSKRVWIALESPFLVDDGYATGVVLSVSDTHAEVEIRQVEERGERTLYGSCRGGVSAAEPLSSKSKSAAYIEQVPLALVSDWRDGQHRFLQRELLGVRFQRWLDQAPGLNPVSLDDAIPLAKSVANQKVADAFEMMGVMRRARAPLGFIAPVNQRLDTLETSAEQLTGLALLHPAALKTAIKDGEPDDLFSRTLAQVFESLLRDYQSLDSDSHPQLARRLQALLRQWATGAGQWQAPTRLQLSLPFVRGT